MSKPKATPVHTSAQPATAPDPYHGVGGEYIRDPITGLRRPAPAPAASAQAADPPTSAPVATTDPATP